MHFRWLYDLNLRHLQVDILEYESIVEIFLLPRTFTEKYLQWFSTAFPKNMHKKIHDSFMTKEWFRDQELILRKLSYGWSTYVPPPINKALLRAYGNPMVSLNKALLSPYFWGGTLAGNWLTSHDYRSHVFSQDFHLPSWKTHAFESPS